MPIKAISLGIWKVQVGASSRFRALDRGFGIQSKGLGSGFMLSCVAKSPQATRLVIKTCRDANVQALTPQFTQS